MSFPARLFRGFLPRLLDELAKELGFTYDFFPLWMLPPGETEFDPMPVLERGEVNVSLVFGRTPMDFANNLLLGRYFYSSPLYDSPMGALVRAQCVRPLAILSERDISWVLPNCMFARFEIGEHSMHEKQARSLVRWQV